jgi:hypothetical protein
LAIEAAHDLARDAPTDLAGGRLPYRAAVDTTEMAIFAVCARSKVAGLEAEDLDALETGLPLIDDDGNLLPGTAGTPQDGAESEYQTGPAATDVAGEAVEVATALASHDEVAAGEVCITKRTDDAAAVPGASHAYSDSAMAGGPVRIIRSR